MSTSPFATMRALSQDRLDGTHLRPGTARRVLTYAQPHRTRIALFIVLVICDALLTVAPPLLLRSIIDDGVITHNTGHVIRLSLLVAAIALLGATLTVTQRWLSATIGEGVIYDLRTHVFNHVSTQPIAFFTRVHTGALVSRLNTDVIGAQQAFTSTLSGIVSNTITLLVIIATMSSLSWPLTIAALLLFPLFLIPARSMGTRLGALTRRAMNVNADLATRMTERFDVSGALLVKLFGNPHHEATQYAQRAGAVRDIGIRIAMNRSIFMTTLTLLASLATALIYGLGGVLASNGTLTVGTLLALTALLARLYTPLIALSNIRVDILTALISFERVFEVLDLPNSLPEPTHPHPLPRTAQPLEFHDVTFTYPHATDISLPSLDGNATIKSDTTGPVLHHITFRAEPGTLTALVGPSGAGKTTITSLVTRLYDPTTGTIRIGNTDLRDIATTTLRDHIGVVTQDPHLFHDTIEANLRYARPNATPTDLENALRAAQIWDLITRLPDGLHTIVGDRGHRLSGGEKQRLAIARLLLKEPGLVILDEATAHLDSESEIAVHHALDAALAGRTALVIAHRLSTVRDADQILVVDDGHIVQRGTHAELSVSGGLYASLYAKQFRD